MQTGPYSIYSTAAAITPSDTAAQTYRAIYVGGAGNVAVKTTGGNTVTFTAPPVGTILPVEVQLVLATGTTATLLIGLA
ncbi:MULTISPECIES: hypothetical protein [Burkholderia]|uniref:Uncharacterized protein n=1 Tax=Burkholderia pyrrocinia TaxID=60550 RepID=A0A318J1W4_BURPY|nr:MULTISPECIES: hypothetical protein [Burkholderia]PXX41093.1 hypothetical protein NA66_1001703 [Burkholderia pyrrocinia]SFW58191.1 hypothetical protein SAMN03159384_03020 [Burkholderia sp. NFACC33-1]SFY11377.1 hypothetical protein SAMN03159408_03232 [Burkholderia sp. NFPP32]